MTDVNTDQQDNGVEAYVDVDHDTAARLGVNLRDVDNALYDSFGQRQVANIYEDLNQYTVVMETAPDYSRGPDSLSNIYVPASSRRCGPRTKVQATRRSQRRLRSPPPTPPPPRPAPTTGFAVRPPAGASGANGSAAAQAANPGARDPSTGSALNTACARMVPLSAIAQVLQPRHAVGDQPPGRRAGHHGLVQPGGRQVAQRRHRRPSTRPRPTSACRPMCAAAFQGTAKGFADILKQEPVLILAALIAIYIVLGMLYESLVHPITVLSTLPSAGVGALLALMIFKMEFSIIALIGIFLLIGLVKKNAIMIIDFALDAQRSRGLSAVEAVREACLLRFRPILMTTLAAGLGALPLAIGFGEGSELRQPLGIAIIGGLIASQLLTLLTTPVVYVYIDRLRRPPRRTLPQPPRRRRPGPARMKHVQFRSARCRALSAPPPWRPLGGCAVGPNYVRPSAPLSPTFKEAAGWSPAAPADTLDRGDWWTPVRRPDPERASRPRCRSTTRTSSPPRPPIARPAPWSASSAPACSRPST